MSLVVPAQKQDCELYFQSDKPRVMRELDPFLTRDPAGIVASFVVGKDDPFGAEQWRDHFGLNVIGAPPLPADFSRWWFGDDPLYKGIVGSDIPKVCETHEPPVLRP